MLQRNKVAIILGIIAKLALISLNPATNPPHPPAPPHPTWESLFLTKYET